MIFDPRGAAASRIRQKKFEILKRLQIPPDGLPGSMVLVRSRCGKPTCHCAGGEGHPGWTLTFMLEGKKQVLRISEDLAAEVLRRVNSGREFREAAAEVFAANARLLALGRQERKRQRR